MNNYDLNIPEVEKIENQGLGTFKNVPLDIDPETLKMIHRKNPEEYLKKKTEASPSKNFWQNTAFGRTLSGRNKAGRKVRKIGLAAATVAGGLLGVDVGGVIESGQDMAQLMHVLDTIETIAWIIAGIIGTLAGGSDYIEIKGEKYDEREILEGKVPGLRKLKQKIKPN